MSTFEEILATIRGLQSPEPYVASFLVAPDVWDRLQVAVPVCRGSSLSVHGLEVRRSTLLPAGAVVPLDQDGNPMLRPASSTNGGSR